jgi:pimeloyl-ACP methyl ester carboxylesterase
MAASLDERSRWIDLDGPVHYLDFGGPPEGPLLVGVHGLGGSAVNWSAIAPLLTDRCRLVAPDMAGHGLTQALGRDTGVVANRALLHRFIESLDGPVILLGNSMGGMISLLEAAAAPDTVVGLILLDPVLPVWSARPDPGVALLFTVYVTPWLGPALVGRRRRSMTPEALVASTLALCCVDRSRVAPEVVAKHVDMARLRTDFPGLDKGFIAAAKSVVRTAGRGYRRGLRRVTAPVLLVHGSRDRLVPVGLARAAARANPSWTLAVLDDVGHTPQLEAPQDVAKLIGKWLDSDGERAAQLATPRPLG